MIPQRTDRKELTRYQWHCAGDGKSVVVGDGFHVADVRKSSKGPRQEMVMTVHLVEE